MKRHSERSEESRSVKFNTKFFVLTFAFCNLQFAICSYAAFLDRGIGARQWGMGGGFVALADDANTVMYNPAGVAILPRREVTGTYAHLFAGMKGLTDSSIAYVNPVSKAIGAFGIGVLLFNAEDFYKEGTFVLSYGRYVIEDSMTIGINLKLLSKNYSTNDTTYDNSVFAEKTSGSGVTFDLGLLRKLADFWILGISGENLTSPNISLYSEDKVPVNLRFGTAFTLGTLISPTRHIANFEITSRNGRITYHLGIENSIFDQVFVLRGGYAQESKNSGKSVSCGFGYIFRFANMEGQFDYGFTLPFNFIENTYGTHRAGLTFKFGQSPRVTFIKEEEARKTKADEERKKVEEEKKKKAEKEKDAKESFEILNLAKQKLVKSKAEDVEITAYIPLFFDELENKLKEAQGLYVNKNFVEAKSVAENIIAQISEAKNKIDNFKSTAKAENVKTSTSIEISQVISEAKANLDIAKKSGAEKYRLDLFKKVIIGMDTVQDLLDEKKTSEANDAAIELSNNAKILKNTVEQKVLEEYLNKTLIEINSIIETAKKTGAEKLSLDLLRSANELYDLVKDNIATGDFLKAKENIEKALKSANAVLDDTKDKASTKKKK